MNSVGADKGLINQARYSSYYCIGRKGLPRGKAIEEIGKNLLVFDPGQTKNKINIKIIDFGLAHLLNLNDFLKEGSLIGSLSYISPEQTGLINREIDNRSDL